MANPTSNFGWQMPTNTDLVKDLPADFEVFGQAVDSDLADLKGGTTGQVLSKTSGTDLDFTWVTPTDQTPLTTKGDLFGYSTADARIPVGADGTILTADSNESLGVKWATPAASNLPKLSFVNPSSNYSTASTTYVDVTGYSITITPASATNTIQVTANLAVQLGTSSNTEFRILVDGVNVGGRIEAPLEATEQGITVIGYVSNLAATSKICKLQMRAAGGISTTVYGSSSGYISNFSVLEIY